MSDEGEDHLVQHMKEYRKYSDLKRAALLAISFTLGEDSLKDLRAAFQEIYINFNCFNAVQPQITVENTVIS